MVNLNAAEETPGNIHRKCEIIALLEAHNLQSVIIWGHFMLCIRESTEMTGNERMEKDLERHAIKVSGGQFRICVCGRFPKYQGASKLSMFDCDIKHLV